uniref:Uncharacterized protein n=1 Tax=Arundo donax TaxID=35708 RepID=A0A0A9D4Z2_ARUDO
MRFHPLPTADLHQTQRFIFTSYYNTATIFSHECSIVPFSFSCSTCPC